MSWTDFQETFRASVRPGITWLLGGVVSGVTLGMAFWGVDKEVGLASLAVVAGFLGQAMTFYFPQRAAEKENIFVQEAQNRVNEMNFEMAQRQHPLDAVAEQSQMGFGMAVPTEGHRH